MTARGLCLPEAEALQMLTLLERTRHGDGEEVALLSQKCGLWWFCLCCLAHRVPLCSFSHTQGAGHRLGLGCWHGADQPGSRDSIQPVLPWGGGRGGLPSKRRAGDLSVGATEKERGETWSLNSRALGCPFRPGCKHGSVSQAFFQAREGISLISSGLRGSTLIFLLQKNAGLSF